MNEAHPINKKIKKQLFDKIECFIASNYSNYNLSDNTFLSTKSNIWFTRIAIQRFKSE
jgi:hypothetical protein